MRATVCLSRRHFLRTGGLFVGGPLLADVLGARRTSAGSGQSLEGTSVIFVTLGGGPSQFETYDPKPDAPAEYRGGFSAISTRTPGVAFSELLPRQAAVSDRLTVIRSIQHAQASHIAEHIVETGYDLRNSANARTGEMPSMGAVVSKVRGRTSSGIPAYVSMPRHHAYSGPHWLGSQHHFFAVNDDPDKPDFQVSNLALNPKLELTRLNDRRALLRELEQARRMHDLAGQADSLDALGDQAFDLLTGERARRAFDIGREPASVRDRYGRNPVGQRMLLARRLVEAGVPFITVRMGDWDDHDRLPQRIAQRAPLYDNGITALIDDLHERGMQRDVLVVAMGEFGRTPRINANAGRDHWPAVNSVVLAGGRFRMGQVVGRTDALGSKVTAAPYPPQSVLSMVYRHLGIDPAWTFNDFSGRPRHILEERDPISELL